ncbi:Meiosis-specific APC/C activator protein AMA1 [Pichia kudriavzevii]|nr:Meiosis-specific APC/C activator protein AMA1 [Pichia kudriavzevii]
MKKVVNAPPDMRILTADISNDFTSVCASISDQSVRIYNVWSSKYDIRSGFNHDSLYGSDIIDSEEGIDKSLGLIR